MRVISNKNKVIFFFDFWESLLREKYFFSQNFEDLTLLKILIRKIKTEHFENLERPVGFLFLIGRSTGKPEGFSKPTLPIYSENPQLNLKHERIFNAR